MSADFWAGYLSGAASILIGNPLDLLKTRLQAGDPSLVPSSSRSPSTLSAPITHLPSPRTLASHFTHASTLLRGATAPVLTYGALNALLYTSYNRTLALLGTGEPQGRPGAWSLWTAGAVAGLATFVVSTPTELVKCRVQVARDGERVSGGREERGRPTSSWGVAREVLVREGVRGLYFGGMVTAVRDAVGYGFYFWSYELSRRAWASEQDTGSDTAFQVLVCGGLAGIITWASIFPLDVIKTRVQTQILEAHVAGEAGALLQDRPTVKRRLGALEIAKIAYREEGMAVFFRGLGICSVRAFIVNAVQWAVYEWMMKELSAPKIPHTV
ncbi:solute carrier family 25 protein [Eremomyces bilateralis CBS 781.70]|uniref:Solute carrier family 25 protein n=1 Tax=Eremomyces bilateralis CBS 781.70 TaxID=1392243 RepID=A0A6G1FUR1_9PEZI|nr:solute carrier family 25 protein [Eremomyces bilateralis CBS 781.70]KAF1809438.1 solute carrier family 25 protein [Eremomyces bilateralis CBS 781.70]